MFDFHEPVIAVETLLKQGRGASVIVEKTYLPAVFRHDDEHLVFLRLAVNCSRMMERTRSYLLRMSWKSRIYQNRCSPLMFSIGLQILHELLQSPEV